MTEQQESRTKPVTKPTTAQQLEHVADLLGALMEQVAALLENQERDSRKVDVLLNTLATWQPIMDRYQRALNANGMFAARRAMKGKSE